MDDVEMTGTQIEASLRNKREAHVISELYRFLMLAAAMMVCLGHGANDVANSISPLLEVLSYTNGDYI